MVRSRFSLALAVAAVAMLSAAPTLAQNAPVYRNAAGSAVGATGVILINPDGSFYSATGGGGGGGGTSDGVAQGTTTSGQFGVLSQGAVTTGLPSYTTGTTRPFSLTTSGLLRIDGSGAIQPVTATALPLPTGAATETTVAGNGTTLTAISGKLPASLGGKTGANSLSVVPASDGFAVTVASLPLPSGAATAAGITTLAGYVDGLEASLGAPADTVCATDTGSCSLPALIKRLITLITTLNGYAGDTAATAIKIDQTTPGTTNGVRTDNSGATASAVPARATYIGAQSGGNLVGVVQASASAFLNMTTNTTTKIITGTSTKKVYVTSFRMHAGGTTTAKFVEGSGSNCGTGTADLTETFDFTASDGSNQGNGLGPILITATAGNDVCAVNSAAVNLRIGVAYEIH